MTLLILLIAIYTILSGSPGITLVKYTQSVQHTVPVANQYGRTLRNAMYFLLSSINASSLRKIELNNKGKKDK